MRHKSHESSNSANMCSQYEMNDQICEQFQSNTISDEKKTNNCLLSSLDQVLCILSQKSCSQFLFESQDKKLSLFIKLINSDLIVTNLSNQLSASLNDQTFKLDFRNVTNVLYKVFQTNDKEEVHKSQLEELCSYRLSFSVEWFRIEIKLFSTLLKTLICSTKSMLPMETRFQNHSSLFVGYLDF